jgi:4-hydroxybenzoate polyprenyltransferase
MLSRKKKILLMKVISLFSVVRGYNIPVIALAQYLAAIFILAPKHIRALDVLLDQNLFILVLASSLSIASGYIINNFYDADKDLINRPNKSMLDRLVSQKTKLNVYFGINFFVVGLSWLVSWRVAAFYSGYIFLIWFYSHKLKKFPIIGNVTAALLGILPFFGILLYYAKMDRFRSIGLEELQIIFSHAGFLFLLLLIREMVKDLENLPGDFVSNYKTVAVAYGEKVSKQIITGLALLTLFPIYILLEIASVGLMDIYLYLCIASLAFLVWQLWKADEKAHFLRLHNLLKLLIVAGVFSIALIEPAVVANGSEMLPQVGF